MNHFIVVGKIVKKNNEPEPVETKDNRHTWKNSIWVDVERNYQSKSGKYLSDRFWFEFWGNSLPLEIHEKYCVEDVVCIEANVCVDSYEKDNKKQFVYKFKANSIKRVRND